MFELPLALWKVLFSLSLLQSQWVDAYGDPQVIFEKYKEANRLKDNYDELIQYWGERKGFPKWYLQFQIESKKRIEIWSLVDDLVRLKLSTETRIKKHERLKELLGNMYWSGALPSTFPEGFPFIAPIPPSPPSFDED